MIPESILIKHHATVVPVRKGQLLFHQGDPATFFYIVKSGKIKMVNYSDDGREFIQGYFSDGQSFGEPPFFSALPYPASAIALEKGEIWKISHDDFIRLLKNNFNIHVRLTQVLSGRLIYKSTMLTELAIEEAEHRLVKLIDYLMEHETGDYSISSKLTFTRQQLADMAGLRVETVIRLIKSLERKRSLEIDSDGKIIWKHSAR